MKHACSVAMMAGLVFVASTAHAQSLADVARQEQERRKTIETPARVYTDADVQKNAPLTTAAARPQPASDATAADASAKSKADDGANPEGASAAKDASKDAPKDEAGWRSKVDSAREDLARSRRLLAAMEQQLVGLGIQASSAAIAGQKGPDQAKQQESAREVERLRADVQKYAEALTKLEGDARDKGVPPGWVR
jgi:hypothetical protein